MSTREQVIEDAKKLYCPPDGDMFFKLVGGRMRAVQGRCDPDLQIRSKWGGPVPIQDLMMVIWSNMLEQMAAVWGQAYNVVRQTPEVKVSDLGKGFLTGLGLGAQVTTLKNPAADRWMEKYNAFRQRMYDYEVIIKSLYTGGIAEIPKDHDYTHAKALKHHFGDYYKQGKVSGSDMPQILLDLVVKPILIGTTASLGSAASTDQPNLYPYSKVGVWPDVGTPMDLLAELQGVSAVGKKIATAAWPWLAIKSQEWAQDSKDLLTNELTAGAVELAAVARINTQDPAAMKALADKEFEDYAGRAKTKIRSGVMPIAALGGLALLLMMKK